MVETEEEEYRDPNDLLNDVGERFYSKIFISTVEGRDITFGQFTEESNRLAHFLESKGVKANDRLVMISPNCIEWMIIFFGVLKYGATIAPVFEEYPEEKIELVLNRIKPRFVFWNKELPKRPPNEGPGELIPFGRWDDPNEKEGTLFSLIRDFSGQPLEGTVAKRDDIAIIDTTSGTTDEPRCVMRNYESFFCITRAVIERWGITCEDTLLEYRSFSWLSAQGHTLIPSAFSGSKLVIAKKFSRSSFFDWLKTHQVTISMGVPTVINMLLEQQIEVKREDFPALRFLTSSSAPLFPEREKKFEELYGIPIVQCMGMTESGWIAANSPEKRKVGSAGLAPKFASTSIVDDEGNILGPGEEGEIVVQGKQVGQGYLLDGGEVEIFAPGGRMFTGDIGYKDEEGFLFVIGRKKNLIIRGGINISPLQISGVLLEHQSIHEAETIGVPDAIYGEEVVCLVTLKQGCRATGEELLAYCQEKMPRQMRPKEVLIMEEIPKTDRGKVSKSELIEVYLAQKKELPGQG